VDQVDRLERADHHLEVHDPALVVPPDHVDAVDADTVDVDLELQHGIARADHLARVAERRVEEHLERGRQVLARDGLADLRPVHHRGVEHRIVGEQRIEAAGIVGPHQFVPGGEGRRVHGTFRAASLRGGPALTCP
jgi:hypothetical protein